MLCKSRSGRAARSGIGPRTFRQHPHSKFRKEREIQNGAPGPCAPSAPVSGYAGAIGRTCGAVTGAPPKSRDGRDRGIPGLEKRETWGTRRIFRYQHLRAARVTPAPEDVGHPPKSADVRMGHPAKSATLEWGTRPLCNQRARVAASFYRLCFA